MKRTLLALLVSLLGLSACVSSTESQRPGLGRADLTRRSPSALEGLVRALEVLRTRELPPDVHLRLRAVEADSLFDRPSAREYVRVVLDLTVFALDSDTAYAAYDAVVLDLESATSIPIVDAPSTPQVFRDMDWVASGLPEGDAFADFVSYSDAIRLEFSAAPDRALRQASASPPSDGGDWVQETLPEYVRATANMETIGLGPVATHGSLARVASFDADSADARELRYSVQPADPYVGFPKANIGEFLTRLEAGSPGVQLVHVEIHPATPGSDVREDRWTFETELAVRLADEFAADAR